MKLDDLLMTQFIVHFVERYAIYHACAKGILHKDLPAPSATREVIPVAWSLDWAGRPIMTEAIIAAISREKWTVVTGVVHKVEGILKFLSAAWFYPLKGAESTYKQGPRAGVTPSSASAES